MEIALDGAARFAGNARSKSQRIKVIIHSNRN